MIVFRYSLVFVAACVALQIHAQNIPPFPGQRMAGTNFPPLPTFQTPSPVNYFRELLAMTAGERARALTNRSPEMRSRILEKVREYELFPPDERELRLRATELRWYLTPLFRVAPAERTARLAQVPEDLREIIKSRLAQWDLLPPPVQREFFENDHALHYFAHIEITNATSSDPERQKISRQFDQFFEFTPDERRQTLGTLSESERAQMQKTLQSFEQMPVQQRRQCVKNFEKFSSMAPAERAEFLKNAERWSKMTPAERQSWRDLVAHVPEWPPLPPGAVPPNLLPPMVPPAPPKVARPNMATN